ncbi:MAG: hypothetical protein IKA99_00670 [Clostridia bacterium]|nr:hypothetical protein [Clostridia bacterium]
MIKYSRYVNPVKTKDSYDVALCIQSIENIDSTILEGIEETIISKMTVEGALKGNIQNNQIILIDSNGKERRFYACFILTYDNKYSQVLAADIISVVEIR